MKKYIKRRDGQRGSITVLVTLILVPTIVVNSFFVDLARLKLWGNQAVMTADSYASSVLSVYDNLLKDLYGLFAISQTDEGKEALDALDDYVKSTFNPNENTITWNHLNSLLGDTEYSGFMPYKDAEVELSYTPCDGATLGDTAVLSTQIGDFMRFRIAQAIIGDGSSLIDSIDQITNMEKNADAIDKKTDFDDAVSDLLERAREYYEIVEKLAPYPEFIKAVNKARDDTITKFDDIANSESYKLWAEYESDKANIDAAVSKRSNLKKGQKLSAEEERLCGIYDRYSADSEARRDKLKQKFNDAIKEYEASLDSNPVDFDNFDSLCAELRIKALEVGSKYETVKNKRAELEAALDDPGVSEDVRNGMKEELKMVDELFSGSNAAQNYIDLADKIGENKSYNSESKTKAEGNVDAFEDVRDAYLDRIATPSWGQKIDQNRYEDFRHYDKLNQLYESLVETFGNGDDEGVKKAKQKKKDAEDKLDEAEKSLAEDEDSDARDIPAEFNMGKTGSVGEFALTRMIDTAVSYFDANSFSEAGNKLLLKLYTVAYDFSMFSNRLTNVEKKSDDDGAALTEDAGTTGDEVATSLTGYELSKKINYLYKAELEYIFGGFNSSDANLADARNKILAFRAIVNFAATYQISEINSAIKAVASLASAVNPALGLAVSAALRLAVAAIETSADWNEMMDGGKVALIKTKLPHLTAYDSFKDLIGADADGSGVNDAFSLGYEDYLMVMLVFMTTTSEIAERTSDLIELNVNTVLQGIGEDGTLSELQFKMDDAVTAIDAKCSVKLGFAVIPDSMARQLLDAGSMQTLTENSENTYTFKVTRGY